LQEAQNLIAVVDQAPDELEADPAGIGSAKEQLAKLGASLGDSTP